MNHKGTFLLAIATAIVAVTSAINTDQTVRNATRRGNLLRPLLVSTHVMCERLPVMQSLAQYDKTVVKITQNI